MDRHRPRRGLRRLGAQRLGTLARTRTHLHGNDSLRALLSAALPVQRIEDLAVPFQCVAASIERASEHWFADGPIVDAVLASAAVPGNPAAGGDRRRALHRRRHRQRDPVNRAVALGARQIFVLHVGRLDRPLEPPRWPWEVGLVAFEVARRHRFVGDLASLPDDLDVHVLATGQPDPPRYSDLSQLRYRDSSDVHGRIARAHAASLRYLEAQGLGRGLMGVPHVLIRRVLVAPLSCSPRR